MFKARLPIAAVLIFVAAPLTAQESATENFVYEAYYSVDGGGLEEWNRQYREYSVPVLEALVEEGLITGFGQARHHTGGDDYNIRFVVRTSDWASLGEFWGEYIPRLQEATPAAEWAAGARNVAKHRDEIWDIETVRFGEGEDDDVSHMYAASYLVNFEDMSEWNDIVSQVLAPVLDEAMQEGILVGWVELGHNTGGPHNKKLLYFVDDWDQLDDLFMKVGESRDGNETAWKRFGEINRAHDDNIWVPTALTDDM